MTLQVVRPLETLGRIPAGGIRAQAGSDRTMSVSPMPLEVFRVDEAPPAKLTQVVAFSMDAALVMAGNGVNVVHLFAR